MWFPIMVFAATGYEHCIANMAFVPLGLMYGADADYKKWLYQVPFPACILSRSLAPLLLARFALLLRLSI